MFATQLFLLVAAVVCVAEATVQCNNCAQDNAVDCQGNTCSNNYCLYERTTQNGVSHVKRSCVQNSNFFYSDNSQYSSINNCERKTINGIEYAVEICNSGSYCDVHCNSSPISTVFSLLFLPLIYLFKF